MRGKTGFTTPCGLILALALAAACGPPPPIEATDSGDTPLYDTFEVVFDAPGAGDFEFRRFPELKFTDGEREFDVYGFYDGDDVWRARFMPDRAGAWTYSWTFNRASGDGRFDCTPQTNPLAHGHVKRHPSLPQGLIHDDGTPHYWFGGAWITAPSYGPEAKRGEDNPYFVADERFSRYLDALREYRHNGLLLKIALFPLENDGIAWDLEWIRRGEHLVREMGRRGIYCQITLFDTWSRGLLERFEHETDGTKHVLDAWHESGDDRKQDYVRNVIARFAGFYNVYWELGNEMEHSNDGAAFAVRTSSRYLPWIRRFDPYGLPIGLSEGIYARTGVDLAFLHQPNELEAAPTRRPWIMNEQVRGCPAGELWKDEVIRDPASRRCYRETFWRVFVHGGSGASEATALDLRRPLDDAVRDVMADQRRLREVLESLPVGIDAMTPETTFVVEAPAAHGTRAAAGRAYLTYLYGGADPGRVVVRPEPGEYTAQWVEPSTGELLDPVAVQAGDGPLELAHPGFDHDLVLLLLGR